MARRACASPLSASGHPSGGASRAPAMIRAVIDRPAFPPSTPDASQPHGGIVVLDDDPDVGLSAQLLLQRRVAPVHCLRRPAELRPALDRLRPAVLLLDMNFGPGRTAGEQGLTLLAETVAMPAPPIVIVMTAYAEIELAVQALRRGAWDFITKPWDNAKLVATCHEAMKRSAISAGQESVDPRHGGSSSGTASRPGAAAEAASRSTAPDGAIHSLARQERAALVDAMAASHGNLSEAARRLGLSRAALYRRLDKHGL